MEEESTSIFDRIYQYTICLLALSTSQQIRTWQFILVAYCHLEALALELLRLHEGTDEQTYWESDAVQRKNLKGAANELSHKHLAPQEIIEILKAVANLRNSVAHKSLVGGMTAKQRVGEQEIPVNYNGLPVFDVFDDQGNLKRPGDPTHSGVNEVTLQHLATDVDRAITELNRRRVALLRGPDGA
jgi:hypothetical protein